MLTVMFKVSRSSFKRHILCTSAERLGLQYSPNYPGAYTEDDSTSDDKSMPYASSVRNPEPSIAY